VEAARSTAEAWRCGSAAGRAGLDGRWAGGGEARRVRKGGVTGGAGWRVGRRPGLVEEVAGAVARWRRSTVMSLIELEVRRLIHLQKGI
jgi:hypothetical protein